MIKLTKIEKFQIFTNFLKILAIPRKLLSDMILHNFYYYTSRLDPWECSLKLRNMKWILWSKLFHYKTGKMGKKSAKNGVSAFMSRVRGAHCSKVVLQTNLPIIWVCIPNGKFKHTFIKFSFIKESFYQKDLLLWFFEILCYMLYRNWFIRHNPRESRVL